MRSMERVDGTGEGRDYYVTDPDDLPAQEPAPGAAGAPPRRPPIAIGAGDGGWPEEHHPFGSLLDVPIAESDLPREDVEALERAGIRTVEHLMTDERHLRDLGLSARGRRRV